MSIVDELRSRLPGLPPENRSVYEATIAKLSDLSIQTELDLLAALGSRSDGRLLACWAAGELRADAALPLLWTIVATDADASIEAAKALLKLHENDQRTSAVPQFAALLESGAAAVGTRIAAAYALGQTNQAAIAPLAATLATPGDDPAVRSHCAEALGALRAGATVPLLIETLRDAHPEVRYWSAYALGEIGDAAAVSALLDLAERDATTIAHLGSVSEEARRALDSIASLNPK